MGIFVKQTNNRPLTVADFVLNTLRERILSGQLPLGSKIDQEGLAPELGVSRIPIRESLRKLEAEGLVRIYPHRGAFVAELSPSEVEEVYLIRGALEELATVLAVPNLTSETLASLARIIEESRTAANTVDFEKLIELNRRFHITIYEAAQRPLLLEQIASWWDRTNFYRHLNLYQADRITESIHEHEELYAVCQSGDAAAAGRIVREHLRHAAEDMMRKISLAQHQQSA